MDSAPHPKVLVIDDDQDFHALIEFMLGRQQCDAICMSSPAEFNSNAAAKNAQVIMLDWQLGEIDGTEMIDPLRRALPMAPIIFVTAHSSPEIAASSIKLGAFDFLTKPLDPAKLLVTITKAVEHHKLLGRLHQLEQGGDEVGFEELIGISPQMRTVYSTIRHIAPTDVSVMICGESGTGKELVASAIHQRSDRQVGRFVPINMAAIPADLAESTLFGHEKGAFTGADKAFEGAVGEAAGGTLFLDEITEMPIDLQSKLLRFLQERVYRPVGGSKDLKADVRIVSATNRDPMKAVQENRLREDLYYRLNVVPVDLPGLREREGDIPLLATHALRRFANEYGKAFVGIAPAALVAMEKYSWSGNVRQLIHVVQRCVVLHDGEMLEAHMLPPEITNPAALDRPDLEAMKDDLRPAKAQSAQPHKPAVSETKEDIISLEQLEREAISRALRLCNGSAYEAAERLGISAATMYRRIKLYGIETP